MNRTTRIPLAALDAVSDVYDGLDTFDALRIASTLGYRVRRATRRLKRSR